MDTQIELNEAEATKLSVIEPKRTVTVTIDSNPRKIRAGVYIVAKLKVALGVDADKELDVVEHGELKPLCDDDQFTVKKGMAFVSHARTGCSS
jgi:hypothetical protein